MDTNSQPMNGEKKVCKCPHHSVVPWMIILLGLDLILGALGVLTGIWPMTLAGIFLVVIGGTKLGSRKCGCC